MRAGLTESPPDVAPSVRDRLERFVSLLERWQATHNLIGRSTLDEIWTRHVADSHQLVAHAGDFAHWVDIGSGAGFPGLVAAIAFADDPEKRFTLVESNAKKAAFLRAAIRETGVRAAVAAERIENYAARHPGTADIVSARALAPLADLCRLAHPLLAPGGRLLLLKGQDFVQETDQAAQSWDYDLVTLPSRIESGGCVAILRNLEPKECRM